MLAVATGGTNPGFYVSLDFGVTFPNVTSATSGTFVSSFVSGDGATMLVLDSDGYFYISTNNGFNWQRRTIDSNGSPIVVGTLLALAADQRAREIIILDSMNGYLSEDQGVSFFPVIDTAYSGAAFRSCAVGDDVGYVGGTSVPVAVSVDFRNWSQYGPSGNWNQIVCSSSGSTAYARVSDMTGDYVYKTTDSGITWTNLTPLTSGALAIACSGSGSTLLVLEPSNDLKISYDGGQSFSTITTGVLWVNQFAMNETGDLLLGGVSAADLSVGQLGLL